MKTRSWKPSSERPLPSKRLRKKGACPKTNVVADQELSFSRVFDFSAQVVLVTGGRSGLGLARGSHGPLERRRQRHLLGDVARAWLPYDCVIILKPSPTKLPDNVSLAEGAVVEPFALGMQAASKAKIAPGDIALVIGSGRSAS